MDKVGPRENAPLDKVTLGAVLNNRLFGAIYPGIGEILVIFVSEARYIYINRERRNSQFPAARYIYSAQRVSAIFRTCGELS